MLLLETQMQEDKEITSFHLEETIEIKESLRYKEMLCHKKEQKPHPDKHRVTQVTGCMKMEINNFITKAPCKII